MLASDPGRLQQWQGSAGRYGIRPYGAGDDACHPKQITKTKNPRTNVRGFCLDVTKKIPGENGIGQKNINYSNI